MVSVLFTLDFMSSFINILAMLCSRRVDCLITESNRSMDLTTVRSVYTINHSCRFL